MKSKVPKDIYDLVQRAASEAIHRAFAAGWDAAHQRHSGLLFSHGVTDWTPGFEEAWKEYQEK